MKAELKPLSGVRRELLVEVPAAEVQPEIEVIVRQMAKKVRMPGFRPGKVPADVVRRAFRKEIEGQLLERLLPKLTAEALKEKAVLPLGAPAVKDVAFAPEQPLSFTADFEVAPSIQAEGYQGLALQDAEVSIADADVEAELELLRNHAASFETVEAERPRRRAIPRTPTHWA